MLETLARLVFPANCAGCGQEGDWLCAGCRSELAATPAGLCRICGRAGRDGICPKCAQATGLDGVISLFRYHHAGLRGLIKTAKYTGQADALGFFVARYRVKLLRPLPDADWTLSFVPLDRPRLIERGFNQAELIADALAGREFPAESLFSKTRVTEHQAGLDRAGRQKNLGKAFELIKTPPENLIICDDVITTGTTLSKLAKLAKRRGTKTVWALTLAHG